jgi:hypothetical protein
LPKDAGSTPLTASLLFDPAGRPTVKATAVTSATPGTLRTAVATPGGIPCSLPDWEFSTIRLPANERSTAWLMVALKLAASTETNATSASPTVSAAAVTIVRPGWRIEFSSASRPVMPRQRTSVPIA